MRWTRRQGAARDDPRPSGARPSARFARSGRALAVPSSINLFSLSALLLLSVLLLSGAATDKHLAIYSTAANYSLPLIQREGHEYIGLLEILEPLGRVSAKSDGQRWRLR